MKGKLLSFLILAVVSSAFLSVGATSAHAVDWQSHEVSWASRNVPQNVSDYYVYFGAVSNGNLKEYSVPTGLHGQSRGVTLKSLQPCTVYSWSLDARQEGRIIPVVSDERFTTGSCNSVTPVATNYAGNSMVADVTRKVGNTNYSGSTVSWSPKPQADHYAIYYGPKSQGFVNSVVLPGNSTTYTIGGLTPGVEYQYQVRAIISGVEYPYKIKTLQLPSGAKPVLGVTTGGLGANQQMCSNQKTLTWTAPSTLDVTKYHVYYGKDGKWQYARPDITKDARQVTIGSLDNCGVYKFRLVAVTSENRLIPVAFSFR